MSKCVGRFELVDHGIDNSQYFQGISTAFTSFNECATGCGDSASDAINDLMEMVAQQDFDTDGLEHRLMADAGYDPAHNAWPKIEVEHAEGDEPDDTYYYVSLLWNEVVHRRYVEGGRVRIQDVYLNENP